MVIHGFRKLEEITEPIDGPESIDVAYFEDLTVPRIVAAVGLIDKVENLGAQAKYRK